MIWFIIIVCVIAIIGITYLFLPLIKKSISKSKDSTSRSEKKELKQSIKKDKKEQKAQKKLERKQAKEEQKLEEETYEPIHKDYEDPDTMVNKDNLDFDGLFETDFNSKNNAEYFKDEDSLNNDYNDIFDDLFANDKPYSGARKTAFNSFSDGAINSDTSFDPVKESEIKDYLNDENFLNNKKNLPNMINDLPPEIKALLLSGVFDKKDI